ncbi:MAG TPA: hypothetical protein VIR58_14255 [Acidimicrobiales bacterium]
MDPSRLADLDVYEVTHQPVATATGLGQRSAGALDVLEAYNATRLPNCTVVGLWDALRHSEPQVVIDLDAVSVLDEIRIIQT